jgi:hypothetical protein
VAHVACWRGPWGANVLLLGVSFSLERASASLEGDFTLIFTLLGIFTEHLMKNNIVLVFWPCRPFYDLKVKLGH